MNRISLADPKPGAYSVGINTTTGLSYNTRFDQTINLSIVPYAPHELLAFVNITKDGDIIMVFFLLIKAYIYIKTIFGDYKIRVYIPFQMLCFGNHEKEIYQCTNYDTLLFYETNIRG